MLKVYLRKAPTLAVIGVTGFVAWPIFFDRGDSGPPKATTRPSATARPSGSPGSASMRDPFRVERPPGSTVPPVAGSPASLVSLKPEPKKGDLPAVAQDEDKILAGMRLGGTFLDDREKLAVIDNKVYTQGDQLRGADGSLLPYVVTDVLKDRALVRRGRRDFVIAFSNTPRAAAPKANAPATPAESPPMAKAVTTAKVKAPAAKGQSPSGSGDPREMILQLLSGLGGSSSGGPGTGGGPNPGVPGAGINSNSISAGLDALMGKYDNIGRGDDASILSNLKEGTTP